MPVINQHVILNVRIHEMSQRVNIWTMQADMLSVGSSFLNNYCNEWMLWHIYIYMPFHSFQQIRFLFLENICQMFEILCTHSLRDLMNIYWNLNFNQNCRFSTQNNNFLKSWQRESIEFSMFSLNLPNSVTKIFVITVKGLKPDTQPPLALETRMLPQCQQNTCRDRIFKLSPIHASVIY